MTTKVTLSTCAWPVQVSEFPRVNGQPDPNGEWRNVAEVPPETERVFYVHSGVDLCFQELPLPIDGATAS